MINQIDECFKNATGGRGGGLWSGREPGMVGLTGCRHRNPGVNSPSWKQTAKNWIDLTRTQAFCWFVCFVYIFLGLMRCHSIVSVSSWVQIQPMQNTPSCVPAWETPLLLCWALKTAPFLVSVSAPLPPAGHGWTCLAFRAAPWRWSRIKLRASEQLYRRRGQ